MNLEEFKKEQEKLAIDLNKAIVHSNKIKDEIKKQTEDLQNKLKNANKDRIVAESKLLAFRKNAMKDKSIHPMARLSLWMNYNDGYEKDWIIDDGPITKIMLAKYDHYRRYQVIDLIEILSEYWLCEIGHNIPEIKDIDASINPATPISMQIAIFDKFPQKAKDKIILVIEDLIKQNVTRFTLDW